MDEWNSVEDKLPPIGYAIVVWNDVYPRSAQGWVFKADPGEVIASVREGAGDLHDVHVTHWMPVPEPPEPPKKQDFTCPTCGKPIKATAEIGLQLSILGHIKCPHCGAAALASLRLVAAER